jgi:dolichyl-diphosphooligosaccharide--protein glycosyltransferase
MRRRGVLLVAILLLALALRLPTMRFDLLLGNDPWYHYRLTEIFLEEGNFPNFDPYLNANRGGVIGEPVGLYFLPAYAYGFASPFGLSLLQVFQLLPALFGALGVLPLFLLLQELFESRTGLWAGLLFALSPVALERSLAGYYRGDVFMLLPLLFALYFFFLSVRRSLLYSLPAALCLFLSALLWNGWPLALAIFSLAFALGVLFHLLRGGDARPLVAAYLLSTFLGFSGIVLFSYHYYHDTAFWRHRLSSEFPLLLKFLLSVSALSLLFPLRSRVATPRRKALVLALLLGGGFLLGMEYGDAVTNLGDRLVKWTPALRGDVTYHAPITEMKRNTLSDFLSGFHILALLAPLGLLFLLRQKNGYEKVFALSLALSSLFLLTFPYRFRFLTIPWAAMLGAILFTRVPWGRRGTLLAALLILLNVSAASGFASSAVPYLSSDLQEALVWIRENTPEDSVVFAWWDYAGPIRGVAHRAVRFDSGPTLPYNEIAATFFALTNESQAWELLKENRGDYVLVDRRLYVRWPGLLVFSRAGNTNLFRSMLYRFYRSEQLTKFEKVYDRKGVKIYRPILPPPKITLFRSDRYYYGPGERGILTVRTRTDGRRGWKVSVLLRDPQSRPLYREERPLRTAVSSETFSFVLPRDTPPGLYTTNAYLLDASERLYEEIAGELIVR